MQQPDPVATDLVTLGRIVGVHGVRGWLKIHSDTQPRENIVDFPKWWISQNGQQRQIKVLGGRRQGKNIIAQLEHISDREQAKLLSGAVIAVERSTLPDLANNEFYWLDLIGCEVISESGLLGRVKRIIETGANDVLVLSDERDQAKKGAEVLVPWVRPDVVTDVDVVEKRISVNWDPDF